MRIPDTTMEKLLLRSGTITAEQLDTLKDEGVRSKRTLQDLSKANDLIDDKTLAKAYADISGIPFVELSPHDIPSDILSKIPERIARQYGAILFQADPDGTYHLAMEDPDDVLAINFLEKEIGTNTKIHITTHDNMMSALEAYRGDVTNELNEVIDIQRADNTENESVSEKEIAEDSPIAKTINLLLEYAIRSHASDIHIEPREGFIQVRYRIDGILKEVNRLPKNVLGALVSRIKILSNLKIDEHRVF
jgi:type IV pilus assembly protein PilB